MRWLPQAGCQGQGVLLWRGAPWSLVIPPRHLRLQLHCFITTRTPTRQPRKQHWPPSKYHICHLCLNHGGGLCLWVWDSEQQGRSALKLAAVTYTEATGHSTVTLYVNPKYFLCFLWAIFVELSWFWIPSKSVHEIQEMDMLHCFSSWLCSRCWKTLCSPVLYI